MEARSANFGRLIAPSKSQIPTGRPVWGVRVEHYLVGFQRIEETVNRHGSGYGPVDAALHEQQAQVDAVH